MNSNYKIGKLEAIFAISIIMVNRIILNLPYSILEQTGTRLTYKPNLYRCYWFCICTHYK